MPKEAVWKRRWKERWPWSLEQAAASVRQRPSVSHRTARPLLSIFPRVKRPRKTSWLASRRGGGRAIAIQADLSREEEAKRLFEESVRAFGRIDALVNNAGGAEYIPLSQVDAGHIERLVALNLAGTVYAAREAAAFPKGRRQDRQHQLDCSQPSCGKPWNLLGNQSCCRGDDPCLGAGTGFTQHYSQCCRTRTDRD